MTSRKILLETWTSPHWIVDGSSRPLKLRTLWPAIDDSNAVSSLMSYRNDRRTFEPLSSKRASLKLAALGFALLACACQGIEELAETSKPAPMGPTPLDETGEDPQDEAGETPRFHSPSQVIRAELAADLASEAGWNLFETPHYFIATPVDQPLLIDGVKSRLEACLASLRTEFGDLEWSARRTPVLRLHPSRSSFAEAGGQAGTTGFWSSPQLSLVIFDAGTPVDRARVTWPALQHVVVHEYLDSAIGLERTPSWLLYGLASKFEALQLFRTHDGFDALRFPADSTRWSELAKETAGSGPPPLRRFLAFNRDEFRGLNGFGSGGYRNLILAWSFVAFLEEPPASGAESDESRADFLRHYVEALAKGWRAETALDEARGTERLEDLDAAWRQWIEAKTGRGLGGP